MVPNKRKAARDVMKARKCTNSVARNEISSQIITRRQKLMTASTNGTFKVPALIVHRKNRARNGVRKNDNSIVEENKTFLHSVTQSTESAIKQVISDFSSISNKKTGEKEVKSSSSPLKEESHVRHSRKSSLVAMHNIISANMPRRKRTHSHVLSAKQKPSSNLLNSQSAYDISDNESSENSTEVPISGKTMVVSLKKDNSVVIVSYSDENHAKSTKSRKIWKIARKSTGGIPKQSSYHHNQNNIKNNITI